MRTGLVDGARLFICFACLLSVLGAARGDESGGGQGKQNKPFAYTHEEVPDVPWSIFVCKVERTNDSFELTTTLGNGTSFGMASVSEQVKKLPADAGQPIAAINGDFFLREEQYEGDPRDLQIRFGELISGPSGHSCFWTDGRGEPQMTNVTSRFKVVLPDGNTLPFELNAFRPKDGLVLYTHRIGASTRTSGGVEYVLEAVDKEWLPLQIGKSYQARVGAVKNGGDTQTSTNTMVLSVGPRLQERFKSIATGTVLRIVTETSPAIYGSYVAIGGGPALVREGKALEWNGFQPRHPRAAVGWSKDHYFLVEVDGRQSQSAGMSFPELAEYMVKLGCQYAMNLDGGGSATMWVLGTVMNSPSEGQERPAANALVVLKKDRKKNLQATANGNAEPQSK